MFTIKSFVGAFFMKTQTTLLPKKYNNNNNNNNNSHNVSRTMSLWVHQCVNESHIVYRVAIFGLPCLQ